MPLPLAGAADVLRAAGLTVVEHAGWKSRGQTDGPFAPRALMWHHDASAPGDSPGVPAMMANLANNGAQFWVDRIGRWHCIAAGRMWHAGSGGGWGRIPSGSGNTYSAGVETDHTTGEAWPGVQVDSLRRGSAALLRHLGTDPADSLCGHKEYRTTNPDPDGLNMAHERQVVASLMEDDMPSADEVADAVIRKLFETRTQDYDGGMRSLFDGKVAGLGHLMTLLANDETQTGLLRLLMQREEQQGTPIDLDRLAAALAPATAAQVIAALPRTEDGTLTVEVDESLIASEVVTAIGSKLGGIA